MAHGEEQDVVKRVVLTDPRGKKLTVHGVNKAGGPQSFVPRTFHGIEDAVTIDLAIPLAQPTYDNAKAYVLDTNPEVMQGCTRVLESVEEICALFKAAGLEQHAPRIGQERCFSKRYNQFRLALKRLME